MNKKRNIIFNMAYQRVLKNQSIFILIAIILTTILFTSLATIGFCIYESFQQETIRQTNNSAHGAIMYISDSKYDIIKKHSDLYKELGYEKIISDSIDNKDLLKQSSVMVYMNESAMKMTFSYPKVGLPPIKSNQIAMDIDTLIRLGISPEIGSTVTIEYTVGRQTYKNDFILSGYWEANIFSDIHNLLISEEFVKEKFPSLINTYDNGHMAGVVHALIKFKSDIGIKNSMQKLLSSCEMVDEQYNVNRAYLSSTLKMDFKLIVFLIISLTLIMTSGYLIINNIYQISVINDIQFYGLLKTVGFTNKQLKKLLTYESIILSIVGIIVGEIVGYIVGINLLPLIISMTNVKLVLISTDPKIFIFSALFSMVTVFISTYKPWKIAKKFTPIEALKY